MLWRSKPRVYSNSLKTPEEVVEVFCDMDAAGKRLSSSTWSEILPYINWREEAMESVAVVVSGFKLSRIEKTNNVANIVVEYNVIGKYWPEKIEPKRSIEKISFKVIKTDTGWKINSPDTMVPHVLSSFLIAHLEKVSKNESDFNAVREIQDKIRMVRKLTEH
jgi:hypothetical protein